MEKKIPVKRLVIANVSQGISTIALVDEPAIMQDFVAFSKEVEIKYAIQNEDQRIIFSPVLIPDLHIPRIDKATGEPYMVVMDRETILYAAIKWAQEGRQNFANEMHDDNRPVDGIVWYNSQVTDENTFSNPKGFENLPLGTLYFTGKVYNDEAWQKVKDKTYKGISMEGMFEMIDEQTLTDEQIEAIRESLL